jgi:hypothetical protein
MNRQQRRTLEKQLGLAKKYQNSSEAEKAEIRARKREMGEKIHQQNLEKMYNDQMAAEEQKQMKFIQSLIESGKTSEEAREILDRNVQIQEKREADLEERKLRRLN